MDQETFVYGDWLSKEKTELETKMAIRDELIIQRDAINNELVGIEKVITSTTTMLETHGIVIGGEDETLSPSTKRVGGIKKILKYLALNVMNSDTMCGEDELVKLVLEMIPEANQKSIRKAIQKMAKDEIFVKSGQRGAWMYQTTIAIAEPPPTPPEDPDSFQLSEKTAEDIKNNILKTLKKKPSGVSVENYIAWFATDFGVENKAVRDVITDLVGQDGYEFAFEGNKKIFRKTADPGSKEELKRTKIKVTPMFKDIDMPE